jgi:hypothetical protein
MLLHMHPAKMTGTTTKRRKRKTRFERIAASRFDVVQILVVRM